MLKRQALFFAVLAAPGIAFSALHRHPVFLWTLAPAVPAAWWAASPVTWPAWLWQGLRRSVPCSLLFAAVLWLLS